MFSVHLGRNLVNDGITSLGILNERLNNRIITIVIVRQLGRT